MNEIKTFLLGYINDLSEFYDSSKKKYVKYYTPNKPDKEKWFKENWHLIDSVKNRAFFVSIIDDYLSQIEDNYKRDYIFINLCRILRDVQTISDHVYKIILKYSFICQDHETRYRNIVHIFLNHINKYYFTLESVKMFLKTEGDPTSKTFFQECINIIRVPSIKEYIYAKKDSIRYLKTYFNANCVDNYPPKFRKFMEENKTYYDDRLTIRARERLKYVLSFEYDEILWIWHIFKKYKINCYIPEYIKKIEI